MTYLEERGRFLLADISRDFKKQPFKRTQDIQTVRSAICEALFATTCCAWKIKDTTTTGRTRKHVFVTQYPYLPFCTLTRCT